jgi:hypothetical protein
MVEVKDRLDMIAGSKKFSITQEGHLAKTMHSRQYYRKIHIKNNDEDEK